MTHREAKVRATAGALAPLVFITSWVVAGLLRDGYSPVHDAISRLAELGAPTRWIVSAGMISFGIGCLLFAPCLRGNAVWAMRIAALSSFGVALFPCSPGCPGGSLLTDQGHAIAAGINYVSLAITPLLHSGRRGLPPALLAGAFLTVHITGLGPNGLFQRAGLTTLDLWLITTALAIHRQAKPSAP